MRWRYDMMESGISSWTEALIPRSQHLNITLMECKAREDKLKISMAIKKEEVVMDTQESVARRDQKRTDMILGSRIEKKPYSAQTLEVFMDMEQDWALVVLNTTQSIRLRHTDKDKEEGEAVPTSLPPLAKATTQLPALIMRILLAPTCTPTLSMEEIFPQLMEAFQLPTDMAPGDSVPLLEIPSPIIASLHQEEQ
jgi:hypothetical protein